MKKMIAARKKYKALGRGTIEFLKPKNHKILAYVRAYEDEKILCVVNLAKSAEFIDIDLSEFSGCKLVEVFGQSEFPEINHQKYVFMMQPHSFFWFEIKSSCENESENK
jgi:maltose alpha-D-glucosyltransferase/alpha-amylase